MRIDDGRRFTSNASRGCGERAELRLSLVGGEVEVHAALVAVQAREVHVVLVDEGRSDVAREVALDRLDLDDVGAEVGEEHPAVRSREDVPDFEDADPRERTGAGLGHSSGQSDERNVSVRRRDSMRSSRFAPSGTMRTPRSVTPASRKRPQPLDHAGLVAGGEHVADVGGVAVLEQPLVVGRVLGVAEHLVGVLACRVDLVVGAQRDRYARDDPRRRPPGVARRPW